MLRQLDTITPRLPISCVSQPGQAQPHHLRTVPALHPVSRPYHHATCLAGLPHTYRVARDPESEPSIFRQKEVITLPRAYALNGGGNRPAFPRAVGDGLLDLRTLRREIEEAESLAEDTTQTLAVKRHWRAYRDHLECALDARIDLLQHSCESHERAISGKASTMCRQYEVCDPSCTELSCMASKRMERKSATAADTSPSAA